LLSKADLFDTPLISTIVNHVQNASTSIDCEGWICVVKKDDKGILNSKNALKSMVVCGLDESKNAYTIIDKDLMDPLRIIPHVGG